MPLRGVELDPDEFCCPICLDLLTDPVTVPCGHSYCMDCIETHLNEGDEWTVRSCPQCRHSFIPRPELVKNTMLAVLVEGLKKARLEAAAADEEDEEDDDDDDDDCVAGAEDVACDICITRKLKAVKSCLQCLASYCGEHLRTHYQSTTFTKHQLVEPSTRLRENVCSRHHEVMRLFCRTDQQCVCCLCSVEDHKGHDTVSAATERGERQMDLEANRRRIQERIRHKEKGVRALRQEAESMSSSAQEVGRKREEMLAELNRVLEERRRELRWKMASLLESQAKRAKEKEKVLEQEIAELRRRDAELERLARTEDHGQFLRGYVPLSSAVGAAAAGGRRRRLGGLTSAVSELVERQHSLSREWASISLRLARLDVLVSHLQHRTRADFLTYARALTLDPNTASEKLSLSEGDRRATHGHPTLKHPPHGQRLSWTCQVLSRESLTGRCYWEVDRSGEGWFSVAVTYKDARRDGDCRHRLHSHLFGYNDRSWALECLGSFYSFWHNSSGSVVSSPVSSRIGVFLDHGAGLLSFYGVSDTMTLLHRVHATFTQPLYVGLWLPTPGATIHICPP